MNTKYITHSLIIVWRNTNKSVLYKKKSVPVFFFGGGGRGASVMVAIFFINNFYFNDEFTLFRNLQEKEQLKI